MSHSCKAVRELFSVSPGFSMGQNSDELQRARASDWYAEGGSGDSHSAWLREGLLCVTEVQRDRVDGLMYIGRHW